MKHFKITALLLVLASSLLTVACSKEVEPSFSESQIVGVWRIPLTIPADVFSAAGQKLIFTEDHIASYNGHLFASWKIEGRDIICTNYNTDNGSRELDMMKLTVNSLDDSIMIAEVQYSHSVDNYIDLKGDFSGIYTRIKENNQTNQ